MHHTYQLGAHEEVPRLIHHPSIAGLVRNNADLRASERESEHVCAFTHTHARTQAATRSRAEGGGRRAGGTYTLPYLLAS